jgi:flagellar hook protein FlgE
MSLFNSLRASVDGIRSHSSAMRNVSGNIAHAKTIGFKARATSFTSLVNAGGGGGAPICQPVWVSL